METVKKCCACGEFKALSEFSSNRSRVDGKIPRCIPCHRAYQKEYRKTYKRKQYAACSIDGTKLCHRCNRVLDYTQFFREKKSTDGYAYDCKTCHYERNKVYGKKYRTQESRQKDNATQRKSHIRSVLSKTSATLSEYDRAFERQNGRCAICGKVETAKSQYGGTKNLAIDHCHTTNTFRGLLCYKCNVGLGYFKDDPELLAKAIAYLTKPVDVARSCEATSVD